MFCSVSDKNEHKKFLNAIPLHVVQYFQQTDDNKTGGRRFEIVARDPRTGDRRHYHWRAATREDCKRWVTGLEQHQKVLRAKLTWLASNSGN